MRRNLQDKIPLKFVLSLYHRHCVSPSHNAFSAYVARWASYEVLHNRTVQQRRLEAFESYHHHILPIRLYVFQWSNWQKPDGKISAQAHIIDPFQAWRHITWHCELEDKLQFVYNMAAKATTKRGLLPGYFESVQQKESKERYLEKLKSIEGQDPLPSRN